jgi:beta-N-acetylhexosaminidase
MMDSEYSVGELVLMGFAGPDLSAETLANMKREKISHFILFAQNYESKHQLRELNDRIQATTSEYSRLPAIISVDQEGGRVQRFRRDFSLLPTARKVGEKGSPQLAFELARIQAIELFSAGIQLNFAPVCDIHTNPDNPVIGDRSFSSTAEEAAKMASAVVRGHLSEGVEPCIKHFPGHGDTHVDSHEALPRVDTPLDLLRTREWIPFQRAMKSGARFLMSAHILLPHLDPKRPGTLSPGFLKDHLRGELNYTGVIVSDDMEMGAITRNYPSGEAPVLALQAGCDLLCYRSESQAMIAIEAIRKALETGALQPEELKRSIDRIRKVRSSLQLASTTLSAEQRLQRIGCPEHRDFISKNF